MHEQDGLLGARSYDHVVGTGALLQTRDRLAQFRRGSPIVRDWQSLEDSM
jgi:hypothetical protein